MEISFERYAKAIELISKIEDLKKQLIEAEDSDRLARAAYEKTMDEGNTDYGLYDEWTNMRMKVHRIQYKIARTEKQLAADYKEFDERGTGYYLGIRNKLINETRVIFY